MGTDKIVNVYDAKTNFSKLLQEVAAGTEVTIARAGEPIARLIPIDPVERELGSAAGLLSIADDFDDTPQEIVDGFYR